MIMARSEQSTRAREIFESALDIASGEERAAYVKSACGGDAALVERVQALLHADHVADSFLPNEPQASRVIASIEEKPGTVIGRYKLLEKIGEGGMGVVYMAEQEEPVRRKVALKIIKLGMDTKQVVARFEAERQALALMDHPNIAKVFDAGMTDPTHSAPDLPAPEISRQPGQPLPSSDERRGQGEGSSSSTTHHSSLTTHYGRPYFVMELVHGVPITEFCDKNQLSVQERIKLFIPVCQAIQSAHQKGIIHRDLKPSNVLVTMHDGVPVPKVIDFGVAKATSQKLTETTLFTNFGTMIGTPAYMSPEQAEMSGLDIDTRSDIYSLGVLLYELLTGTTPFPEQRLRSVAYSEMQRIIVEEEPERPSTRLRRTSLAASPGRLAPRPSSLATDLDWIVMKCLEKDRNRRYETATAIVAEIRAHLTNEPIVARPPSAAYRFQKLVRRHRIIFTTVILVTVALLLGVAVATLALIRERRAREREQAALEQANQQLSAAKDFVKQVFDNVEPRIARLGGVAEARQTLTQGGLNFVHRLRALASDDPELRVALARLLIQAAESQNPGLANTVGDYTSGLQQADTAFELLRDGSPTLTPSELSMMLYHAREAAVYSLYGLGKWEEAIARLPEVEAMLDQLEAAPSTSQWVRERRANVRLDSASALVSAGRPREAIQRYLQPFLTNDWARNINVDSKESQQRSLIAANDNLTSAYAALKDFDAMLPWANEAVRIAELLVKKFPRDARYAAGQPYSWSMQGYAKLRTGDTNGGLAALTKARQEIERLIRTDPANDLFRYMRAIVAANQAMAWVGWSQETVASLSESETRLSQAEQYLVEAEQFCREAKAKQPERFLTAARTEVATARAKFETGTGTQPKP
jgi:serine/threonine protein kinase/tetratricopeptide (TPR) repeat protein